MTAATAPARVVTVVVLGMLLAACGAGPSDRPGVAVDQRGVVEPAPGPTTTAPVSAPELTVPMSDLPWRDCTEPTLDLWGLGAGPQGLILECAEVSTPIDASGAIYGTFTAGAMRARLPETPLDAPPLVLTSGSDRPSTVTLAGLAAGPAGALLTSRPLVALDRRGIGTSTPIDCIPPETRSGLLDHAQSSADPAATMAELSQSATIACKDFLQPQELAFDAAHAADDLEQLRLVWEVDAIAILGSGNGATVALAYAQKYPAQVGRLILDAPEGVGADITTLTEYQVRGAEAALAGFANRCVALKCSLGADPETAVADLVRRAGAGEIPGVSAAAMLTAIGGFLGSPRSDQQTRTAELSDALTAAGSGDTGALSNLILREQSTTAADGQFIARCTDGQQWPAVAKVRELADTWAERYPVFGRQAALGLLTCSAWPVAPAPPLPTDVRIPVLVTSSIADPVVGNDGLASVSGAVAAAGGNPSGIGWQGWGHPVTNHSSCAQQAVVEYVATAKLPANGTVCPA